MTEMTHPLVSGLVVRSASFSRRVRLVAGASLGAWEQR